MSYTFTQNAQLAFVFLNTYTNYDSDTVYQMPFHLSQ